MFIFRRKNRYYYVVYEDRNGKRKLISTKTKSKREATKFLANFNKEIQKRNEQETIPITLKEFRWKILKRLELTHAEKTLGVYKTTFRYFIEYFGNIQLTEITKPKIKTYLDSRIMKTSIYAARKDLINLKAAFNIAVEDNYMLENPCKGIKQFKIPEKQPLYFSREEYQQLKSTITDIDFKDLVKLAINTGMRQMGLLTLTWQQINFNDKMIMLDNRSHVTKSKRIRSIPMNQTVVDTLSRRQLTTPNGTVFHFLEIAKQNNISHKFKHFVLQAGLNPKYHFHTLRHTFASWLIQEDVSIYYVSKLLGHADIKTTEIYA
ncbi:MAG: site-specific integrase, partial [Melioribacteraceae bacterium]|nr:site-specific integrase [Melioribacteraceae bacterium]